MNADRALYFLNEMLIAALYIGMPIMLVTLCIGLLISIIQVTTQIQEITLAYVPKILAAALMLIALGPWMLGKLASFAISLYGMIPTITS